MSLSGSGMYLDTYTKHLSQFFNKQMSEELADAKTALVCHTAAAAQREGELAGALEREQGHLQQAVAYYEQVRLDGGGVPSASLTIGPQPRSPPPRPKLRAPVRLYRDFRYV